MRLLGLGPDADRAAIDRAWRRLARRLHPDRNPGREEAAAQLFTVAVAARDRLVADLERPHPSPQPKRTVPRSKRPIRPIIPEPRRAVGVLVFLVAVALTIRWAPAAADAVRLQSADASVAGTETLGSPYDLALAAGDTQFEAGRFDEARRQYGFALETLPGRPDAYERLARVAEVRADRAAAEAWRRAAVAANPYHPDPRVRLARFYFYHGRWSEAAVEGWRAVSRSLYGPS